MNRHWLICAIVLASGCGARVESEATDTNTNWLSSCDEASDCDSGLECLCGRCTVRCDESQECTARDAQATCLPSNGCEEKVAACGLPDTDQTNTTQDVPPVCPLPIELYTFLGECASPPSCGALAGTAPFSDECGCGCAPAAPCPWEVNDLLEFAGISDSSRFQCGNVNSAYPDDVAAGFQCISDASDETGAEFTVNDCIDCSIPSTYVRVPGGELYRVFREEDIHGDDLRNATLERCESFDMDAPGRCAGSMHLYQCSEPLPPL